jgi:K+-dependent Na+/Ca+ exchanger-like protein
MRLMHRYGEAITKHAKWTRGWAFVLGVLLAVAAFTAEQLGGLDSLDGSRGSEGFTNAQNSARRLFYPDDYIIGRYTEDGEESFETVTMRDPKFPGQNIEKTEKVGSYEYAPAGRKVGIILHIIVTVYMLVGLNTICDVYFCGALDEMGIAWNIQTDVAGATFMAAGGSAPEFFTALIGAVGVESDVGFSTIVGSAVFNVLAVIGCCGMAAKEPIELTWWPLLRDCSFYIFSLCLLAIFCSGPSYSEAELGPEGRICLGKNIVDEPLKCGGGKVELWEAIVLFLMYLLYCTIMYFNVKLKAFVEGLLGKKSTTDDVTEEVTEKNIKVSEVSNDDPKTDLHKAAQADCAPLADTIGSLGLQSASAQSSIPETTTHRGSHSRPCHADSKPHIHEKHIRRVHHHSNIIHSTSAINFIDEHSRRSSSKRSFNKVVDIPANLKVEDMDEDKENDGQAKDDDAANGNPEEELASIDSTRTDAIAEMMSMPESPMDRALWVLFSPLYAAMYYLIPRPSQKLFLLTFGLSLVFIGFYSYWLVYCVQMFSDAVLGGSAAVTIIMGFTLLAAGTSIPDLVSSMAVARAGEGDMAVSSSIGSNIFDILVGLPVPWIVKIGIVEMGVNGKSDYGVIINSPYIAIYVILLLFMVAMVILSILINKWYLNKVLGIIMGALYCLFLLIVIPLELFQFL